MQIVALSTEVVTEKDKTSHIIGKDEYLCKTLKQLISTIFKLTILL